MLKDVDNAKLTAIRRNARKRLASEAGLPASDALNKTISELSKNESSMLSVSMQTSAAGIAAGKDDESKAAKPDARVQQRTRIAEKILLGAAQAEKSSALRKALVQRIVGTKGEDDPEFENLVEYFAAFESFLLTEELTAAIKGEKYDSKKFSDAEPEVVIKAFIAHEKVDSALASDQHLIRTLFIPALKKIEKVRAVDEGDKAAAKEIYRSCVCVLKDNSHIDVPI